MVIGTMISQSLKAPSAILDDDSAIERIWKEQYPLADFTAPSNFKSYEELKTRLDAVLSGKTSGK